jgi:hypothetical protein
VGLDEEPEPHEGPELHEGPEPDEQLGLDEEPELREGPEPHEQAFPPVSIEALLPDEQPGRDAHSLPDDPALPLLDGLALSLPDVRASPLADPGALA